MMAQRDLSLLAYTVMGMPGYSAYIRGEAAQFYRCTPVPARLRNTEDCFLELPVTIDGKPMYLQPKTRTITNIGTEVTCNHLATALYKIKSQWHVLTPKPEGYEPAPGSLHMNTMPWGSKPVDTAADTSTDEETVIDEDSQPVKETTYIISISATQIIIWIIILIAIITIYSRYRIKDYSPAQQQHCDYSQDSVQHKQGLSGCHNTEASAEPTYNIYRNIEPVHPTYKSQQEVSEMTEDIYNLKEAYQRLEMRLNNCTYPMQSGLNKLAVASSKRCS